MKKSKEYNHEAGAASSKGDGCDKRSSSTKMNDGRSVDADDSSCWYHVPQDIFKNRKNPINGTGCFFSEAKFKLVVGPEPSFEEKLEKQIAFIKAEKQKQQKAELTASKSKKTEQENKPSKVEHDINPEDCSHISPGTLSKIGPIGQSFSDDSNCFPSGMPVKNVNHVPNMNAAVASDSVNSPKDLFSISEKQKQQSAKQVKLISQELEQKSSSSVAKHVLNSEVTPHFATVSFTSAETVDSSISDKSTVIDLPESCPNNKLMKIMIHEPAISAVTVSAFENSSPEDPCLVFSEPLKPKSEKTRQKGFKSEVEHILDSNATSHVAGLSLSTDGHSANSFSDSSEQEGLPNCCLNNEPVNNVNNELVLKPTTVSTFVNSPSSHNILCPVSKQQRQQEVDFMEPQSRNYENNNSSEVEHTLDSHSSLYPVEVSLTRSVSQDLSNNLISLPDSCPDVKPVESDSRELDSKTSVNSTFVNSPSKDISPHIKTDKVVDCRSVTPELGNKGSPHEGHSVLSENSTSLHRLVSSSHYSSELFLIMPPLSSDDDSDDDNKDFEEIERPFSTNKHAYHAKPLENISQVTAECENLSIPASHQESTGENEITSSSHFNASQVSVSSRNPGDDIYPENDIFSTSVQDKHLKATPVKADCDTDTTSLQNAEEMQTQSHSLNQQLDQVTSYIPHLNHADQQPSWSESDIPIFSVKEPSPEPVNFGENEGRTVKVEEQRIGIMNMDDKGAPVDTKLPNFKKSNLTQAEHVTYLKLYNKYIRSFKRGTAPPILTEVQIKEISLFEKLQRQVLEEQEEFQNYLWENAKKNPRLYTFLRAPARQYATRKALAFRCKKKNATSLGQTIHSDISLCPDAGFIELRFQQTLLEVGVPPTVKLPDVQNGHKPEPIPCDMEKLDAAFPRYSKKTVPGHIHHEPASLDNNVKTLAAKYNFQVVMSSSVVKCLLDNHGPNFEREWTIPINVIEVKLDGTDKKIVCLDKPFYEKKPHMRDHNTLFHKYALRTYVSHPKRRPTRGTRNLYHDMVEAETSRTLDDLFDRFSTKAEELETFGVGYSKLDNVDISTFQELDENDVKPSASLSGADLITSEGEISVLNESTTQKTHKKMLKGKKYIQWDEVVDDVSNSHSVEQHVWADSEDSVIKSRRGHSKRPYQEVSPGDLEAEGKAKGKKLKGEHNEEQVTSFLTHNVEVCEYQSSGEINQKQPRIGKQHCLPPETDSPQSPEPAIGITKGSHDSNDTILTPTSPTDDQNCSSRLPIQEIPSSPVKIIPTSPVKHGLSSPVRETPISPVALIPVREIPASPVRAMPSSPVKEAVLPSVAHGMQNSPPTAAASSVPCWRSPRRKINKSALADSSSPISPSADTMNRSPSLRKGAHCGLFTQLDAILGPSFGNAGERNVHNISKENPSQYLPPTEIHSSLVYSLWSLGTIIVLIRSRCHGIIKDLKKTRRVYFSPKMEYQTSYGLEQVTLSEVARDWMSCYIRPNTNLLRARINAFTSEILMFEELETNQILQPSLNFRPENGFQLLDRVLRQAVSLKCGRYFLCHEAGDNFCEIRSVQSGADKNKPTAGAKPKKMVNTEEQVPWIPIDPTILLPFHIANNRIPATFLPKDHVVKNFNLHGQRRNQPSKSSEPRNQNGSNSFWGKHKKKKKKNSKKKTF